MSTPNQSTRGGVKPTFIVLHHMATTGFEGVLESWRSGRKQGSAHYAISNGGEVVSVVPEQLRAWSLSSAAFDSKAIVFEIANKTTPDPWPVSDAATFATARVVADIAARYGIPLDRDHVIGHSEVHTRHGAGYGTKCPGGLDLDLVVSLARIEAAVPGVTSAPASTPAARPKPVAPTTRAFALNLPTSTIQLRIQKALRKRGRYSGPLDGVLGSNGFAGIQKTLAIGVGYDGPIDGAIGVVGAHLIQRYAAKFGSYSGPIDGILGVNSWAGFALGLERP